MNKKLLKINICIFFMLIFSITNIIYSKDLNYEVKVSNHFGKNILQLQYSTFVKAASGAKSRKSSVYLKNKNGGRDYYETNAIMFHNEYTSDYSLWPKPGNSIHTGYDKHRNSGELLTPLNLWLRAEGVSDRYYTAYKDIVEWDKVYINYNNTESYYNNIITFDDMNAEETQKVVYGNLMISDFNIFYNGSEELYKKFAENEVAEENGTYKLKVSNLLKTSNKLFYTAYELMNHLKANGFSSINFGGVEDESADKSKYIGQSALNNYDNNAYIPADTIKHHVYVRYIVTYSDGTVRSLTKEDMGEFYKEYNGEEENLGTVSSSDGLDWVEHYELSSNETMKYVPSSLVNNYLDPNDLEKVVLKYGLDYEQYGPFNPTNFEDTKLNVGEYKNTHITYYLKEKTGSNYNILVRHVDRSTQNYSIIEELSGSERLEGFNNSKLVSASLNTAYYQSFWQVSSGAAGNILSSENFSDGKIYNCNGILYQQIPEVSIYKGANIEEAVGNLVNGTNGVNIENSFSAGYTYFSELLNEDLESVTYIVTFYYKQVNRRELYINHVLVGTDKILYNLKDTEQILDNNNKSVTLNEITDRDVYPSAYYFDSDISLNIKANDKLENYQYITDSNGNTYKLVEIHTANGQAGDGGRITALQGALYNASLGTSSGKYIEYKGWEHIYDPYGKLKKHTIVAKEVNDATIVTFYYEQVGGEQNNNTLYIGHYCTDKVFDNVNGADLEQPLVGYTEIEGIYQVAPYDDDDESLLGIEDSNSKAKYDYYTDLNVQVKSPIITSGIAYSCYGYIFVKGFSPTTFKFKDHIYGINKDFSNITVELGKEKNNYKFIVFLYSSGDSGVLEKLSFTGYLDFINHEFKNSTDNSTLKDSYLADDIPSGETLDPYVKNAYPYIVRGLKYEEATESRLYKCTITFESSYYYTTSSTDAEGNTTITEHTGDYSASKEFNVTINMKYYKLTDFFMYRISDLQVIDSEDDLFYDVSKRIDVSNEYIARFNGNDDNKPGINTVDNNEKHNWYFDEDSFKSQTINLGTYGNESTAQNVLNSAVADAINEVQGYIEINFEGTNDYVYLDGNDDMLTKNTQKIEGKKLNDYNVTFDLDATNCNYTKNLDKYMKPTEEYLTDYDDFDGNITVSGANSDTEGDNGIRLPSGKLTYTLIDNDDTQYKGFYLNTSGEKVTSRDYTYKTNSSNEVEITSADLKDQVYSLNGKDMVRQVNILTPLRISDAKKIMKTNMEENGGVNQTLENATELILQKGVKFEVTPDCTDYSEARYSNNPNTDKYVKDYYIVCDFDVSNVEGADNLVDPDKNNIYTLGSVFRVEPGKTFSAIPISIQDSTSVAQDSNHIYVFATTYNIPVNLENQFVNELKSLKLHTNSSDLNSSIRSTNFNYCDEDKTVKINIDSETDQKEFLNNSERLGASNHIVYKDITTKNIGRIYDFAVTDCTDVNFKNVFRKNESNNVNDNTGAVYYSGTKRWLVTGTSADSNWYAEVDNSKTILPLGPYKNFENNSTYIFAPKLGYRFSYDLKTTGYLEDENNRKIVIYPRYYYIDKYGNNFLYDTSNDANDGIDLYYKDTSGKYKKITTYTPDKKEGYYNVNSGTGNYNIYFKPKDGYRYSRALSDKYLAYNNTDFDFNTLSTKLVKIPISYISGGQDEYVRNDLVSSIVLNNNMMALARDKFTQAWYGEFKLPNTTIAVKKGESVNNPLKDGYIGVIFDIYCVDAGNGYTLSYSKNNSTMNTSQWDYEGYLGFKTPGSKAKSMSIQLERGTWNITDEVYNKIKGTVILYDIDDRAASDFE